MATKRRRAKHKAKACMSWADMLSLRKLSAALPKATGKRKASIIAKVRRLVKNKRTVCAL